MITPASLLKPLVCALILACGAASSLAESPAQAGLVAWGDSLTYGTGAVGPEGGKSWTVQFAELSGIEVINKGVGGETSTQIRKRMLAETALHDRLTVIWAGRNNAYATDTVKADIAAMVVALAPGTPYLVVGVTNTTAEIKSSDPNYPDRWKLHLVDKLNAALAETYGPRFVDVRPLLVGAYDPSLEQDRLDHEQDIIPSSLRSGGTHLNERGYAVVAKAIHQAYQAVISKQQSPAIQPTR
jgi:lysophospholipase L1-like esterase